jgi:histidinol-phosphate/aromatic aminotransferase/cobyric acid decarboxylase-like protein
MLRQGVIIRPLAAQGLAQYLRISVGTVTQNKRAITAFEKALQL